METPSAPKTAPVSSSKAPFICRVHLTGLPLCPNLVSVHPECSCSPCGTESCDPHNGQCHCKPGVTGPRCDRCEVHVILLISSVMVLSNGQQGAACETHRHVALKRGFRPPPHHVPPPESSLVSQDGSFGFESCSGCRHCDCDASAALVQPCDPQSGQCTCQPGVNGPNCKQCAPGYWDYGPDGCKSE